MDMILYGSPTFVKEILYEMDKDDYDKIVKNSGTEASVGLLGKLKGTLCRILEIQGDIEGHITKNVSTTKEITDLERNLKLNNILEKDKKKLEGHLDSDFTGFLSKGLYSFSGKCQLREYYKRNVEPQIVVEFSAGNYKISGSTSMQHWGSRSALNNILSCESIFLHGFLYVLDITNNEQPQVHVQYILLCTS